MASSNLSAKKYVLSTAFVTSLVLTPVLSGSVFANAGEGASEDDIPVSESNLPSAEEQEAEVEVPSENETSLIQRGDMSSAVEDLQQELQDQGYYTYNIDGMFGPITEEAVRVYQADQNLQVDGIVGPNTSDALALSTVNSSSSSEGELNIVEKEEDSSDSIGSDIVAAAESVVGTPYVWGGATTEGMDSSGFINYVFDQVDIDISRTHADMWENDGVHVDSPSVGDVVFFEGTYDTEGASHSGIVIGDNQMVHAGNDGVRVADYSNDYWQDHYIGAKSFTE